MKSPPSMCGYCKKPFKKSKGRAGPRIYCKKCTTPIDHICKTCGEVFKAIICRSRQYCSRKCSAKKVGKPPHGKGTKHARWNGGRHITHTGYVLIIDPIDGHRNYEHRIVMENSLGRKLRKNEVVHHKNGDRQDNRPKNLELFTKKNHDSMETKKRWKENGTLCKTIVRCGKPTTYKRPCRRPIPCGYH